MRKYPVVRPSAHAAVATCLMLILLSCAPVLCTASDQISGAEDRSLLAASKASLIGPGEDSVERLRIGTFNIRNFPCNNNCACKEQNRLSEKCARPGKPSTDLRRLADTIGKLKVHILAVNEILNPERLARFAVERLGPGWKFTCAEEGDPRRVGFLYDSSTVTLKDHKAYPDIFTSLKPEEHPEGCIRGRRAKLRPAYACRFEVKGTPFDFYAVVLHLKSGPCPSIRRAQWKLMERVVDQLSKEDEEIIVLGDFNSFGKTEKDFDEFCRNKHFTLVTGDIPCTHLYGSEGGTTLDNVLVSRKALDLFLKGSARAGGACGTGCVRNTFWKAYQNLVSDHCPVVVEFRTSIP